MKPDIIQLEPLREAMPLPRLMDRLGYGKYAKASCESPFRKDEQPSWGIYRSEERWYWKDHGTGEGGDEIDFLAQVLRIGVSNQFLLLLVLYDAIAHSNVGENGAEVHVPDAPDSPIATQLPDRRGFEPGSINQIGSLAQLRDISIQALKWAQERGILVFNPSWYYQEVYGVTDQSGRVLEIRRLDGKAFRAAGDLQERKSHAVKGSQKSWPVGILEAKDSSGILLVEGLPDLLAAHEVILRANRQDDLAPVAMLSSTVRISHEALPYFENKRVLICPHNDQSGAGLKGAAIWAEGIRQVAQEVAFIDLRASDPNLKDVHELIKKPEISIAI